MDRALVLVLVATAIAEGILRPGLASRPVQVATAVVIVARSQSAALGALGVAEKWPSYFLFEPGLHAGVEL